MVAHDNGKPIDRLAHDIKEAPMAVHRKQDLRGNIDLGRTVRALPPPLAIDVGANDDVITRIEPTRSLSFHRISPPSFS
jgi:hypothetical protein